MEKVTRAELSDIIGKLRIKADKYADKDLALMAARLIAVHNMGLPDTGLLTHVSCVKEWILKSGLRNIYTASRVMGWNRDTITKYIDDTEMENHVVVFDKIYRRVSNKKAGD